MLQAIIDSAGDSRSVMVAVDNAGLRDFAAMANDFIAGSQERL